MKEKRKKRRNDGYDDDVYDGEGGDDEDDGEGQYDESREYQSLYAIAGIHLNHNTTDNGEGNTDASAGGDTAASDTTLKESDSS